MPLNDAGLLTSLQSLLGNEPDQLAAAAELQSIISTYVKTATVNVNPGIAVQVVPATGTGSTTSPGTGNLT